MHSHVATFAFQTVNFLVLAGVLRYWLYRPVQAMIARRQREVEAPLTAAAAERTKAAELRAEAEREHLAAADERDRFLLEAGRDAEARRDQLLIEARRSAETLLEEGQTALARERSAVESNLQARAAELAAGIAGHLLTMSGVEDASARLLDEALRTVESMDGSGKGAADGSGEIRVVTAVPLETAKRQAVSARLHRALGDQMAIAFAEDAALLAGAEIHLPTAVVRHSWSEQVAQVQRSLKEP